ncbi:hypothetical protein GPLA_3847 [Paraglaciecola polaris LMG 21857]|uniref:Uncharacterized protein n=1 Tax=Paraglaciecola polaris LMG 21857 TaxID=1129793 RepID=K6ZWV2_9ALTE|nr:hypothetical protein GPLA_3847 [Paraglaciecola polaris LMG 21857]
MPLCHNRLINLSLKAYLQLLFTFFNVEKPTAAQLILRNIGVFIP